MQSIPVLVTGAGGFLGQALVSLLSQDRSVRGAVHRGKPSFLLAGVKYVSTELSDVFDWSNALIGTKTVVHCAARVHILHDTSPDPMADFRAVNVNGTLRLARQAAEMDVERFVFISSIGVLGDQTFDKPFSEEDKPHPRSAYALSKLEAELGLWEIERSSGMEVVVIRPPVIYGSNAPGNFDFLMRCLRRRVPLPLGAVVDNRRSFIFLENLVEFIRLCIDHPSAANQTFLVSDGEDLSTAELLRRLGGAMGKPAKLIPVSVKLLRVGAALIGKPDVFRRLCGSLQVDISYAQQALGWLPPITVDEGLRRTVAALL